MTTEINIRQILKNNKMSEMRIRPKSDYLHTASWEELHILSGHWLSDVAFYKDEIRFLDKLLDKYFIWLLKDDNIQLMQKLIDKIKRAETEAKRLDETIHKHIGRLEALIENAFSHDEQQFRNAHVQLENDLVAFIKELRLVKKEVFAITEKVIESEKLQHLLIR